MSVVFVAGHRNPDMDCTCAAYAYAALKGRTDPANDYVAIRSGPINAQIELAFARAGVDAPEHRDTIAPTVGEVAHDPEVHLHVGDPILEAIRTVRQKTVSAIPVFDFTETLVGVVGVNEIADYVLSTHGEERPVYTFRVENLPRVLPGTLHQVGDRPEFSAPIMTGSMPLAQTISRLAALSFKPLLVVGNRTEILSYAVESDLPAIVVTGVESIRDISADLTGYRGAVFLSDADTAESIRLVRLSAPVATLVSGTLPRLSSTMDFEEAKRMLLSSQFRGLPVFEEGRFKGMVTRRSFIERPRPKIILMDHNELPQAVDGSESAEIVEIVDHHRLSAPDTATPISVTTRPVGSTCTLVWQEFRLHGEQPDPATSVLLLSGIISDTVNLNSPTTTAADALAVEQLAAETGIDPDDYASELFAQLKALQEREPREIVESDFKQYDESGVVFGIGQVEVTTLRDSEAYTERLSRALERTAADRGIRWAMLMVTDVMKRNSLLLTSGYQEAEERLPYHREADRLFYLPDVVSRKKQLLPGVLQVIRQLHR